MKELSPNPKATTPLSIRIKKTPDGSALSQRGVLVEDLAEPIAELWRERFLRTGELEVPRAGLTPSIIPQFQQGNRPLCAGYSLEVVRADGKVARLEFSIKSLGAVASRMATQLVEQGRLQTGETYYYDLVFLENSPGALQPANSDDNRSEITFESEIKSRPLQFLSTPLRPLLAAARAVDLTDDGVFPVFYTESSLRLAEEYSRKASTENPRLESGGVLVGLLGSCPDSGELFAVITDVWEALDTEQSVFSLSYTGLTWQRIQTVLNARQQVQPLTRLLGQAHGHNFLPGDGQTCEGCLQRPVCSLNNVFASSDDVEWTRAVYANQPWSLCHIYGMSARGDLLNSIFTWKDGRLQARGYFVLPEFSASHLNS